MFAFIVNHKCFPSKVIKLYSIVYAMINRYWFTYRYSLFVDLIFVTSSFIYNFKTNIHDTFTII